MLIINMVLGIVVWVAIVYMIVRLFDKWKFNKLNKNYKEEEDMGLKGSPGLPDEIVGLRKDNIEEVEKKVINEMPKLENSELESEIKKMFE